MKKKTVKMFSALRFLVVLLLVYLGVRVLVEKQEANESEENQEQPQTVFSASVDEIKQVKISLNEKNLVFVKEEDLWVYKDDPEFPLSQNAVEEMLASLASVEAEFVIEKPEDLSEYNLDSPAGSVGISTEEGETVLLIGLTSETAGQSYIRKEEDTESVYVVSSVLLDSLNQSLYDYAEMEAFPDIDTNTVNRLEVAGEDVDYILEQKDALWSIHSGNGAEEKADSAKAASMMSSLGSIEYASFVNYHSEDDSQYGLDEPYAVIKADYQQEVAMEATLSEGEEFATLSEGEEIETETVSKARQMELWVGNEAENDTRYVKMKDSEQIYTITQEMLDIFLAKSPEELWDLTVSYLYIEELSSLAVEREGEVYEINVSRETLENEDGEEETTTVYLLKGEEVDTAAFETFYNKVINMTAQSGMKEEYKPSEAPEISIELQDLRGNKMRVSYYEHDSSFYAAVIDKKVYLVNKMNVKDLLESFDVLTEEES